MLILPTTRQVSSPCKQRACLPETQLSAWNIIILPETQLFCLEHNYLAWKKNRFAWNIIIMQQKLVFLEHKPRTKESSLILFWLSTPGRDGGSRELQGWPRLTLRPNSCRHLASAPDHTWFLHLHICTFIDIRTLILSPCYLQGKYLSKEIHLFDSMYTR